MYSRRAMLATLLAAPAVRAQEGKPGMFADAAAYEGYMGRWSSMLAPLLVDLSGIGDGGRILDVGSGTGVLAFSIARAKPRCQVVGIDPSKEYIAYAESKNAFKDRARFETGDAQQLKFGDASFDHSLALLVFNFIPDPAKALREISRVTKPGGSVAAAVWDYSAGMRMLKTFWDSVKATDPAGAKYDEDSMPLCRSGELGALWKQVGLDNVTERPLDITMRFSSFADYWNPFLNGQGPAGAYVRQANEDRRQVLRTELKRRLHLTGEDVPFTLPSRAWAVRGTVRKSA